MNAKANAVLIIVFAALNSIWLRHGYCRKLKVHWTMAANPPITTNSENESARDPSKRKKKSGEYVPVRPGIRPLSSAAPAHRMRNTKKRTQSCESQCDNASALMPTPVAITPLIKALAASDISIVTVTRDCQPYQRF